MSPPPLYYGPLDVNSAIARCEALLLEHDGDRASEANLLVWLGGLEAMLGHFSEARHLVGQAEQRYGQLGLDNDTYLRLRGAVELLAGSPDLAEEALRTSCVALQQHGQSQSWQPELQSSQTRSTNRAGTTRPRPGSGVARESAGSDDLDAAFAWQLCPAKVLARVGAIDEAEQLAREAVDLVARTDALNRHGDSLLALGRDPPWQGSEDEALEQIREALELYEQKGNVVSAERAKAMLFEGAIPE